MGGRFDTAILYPMMRIESPHSALRFRVPLDGNDVGELEVLCRMLVAGFPGSPSSTQ